MLRHTYRIPGAAVALLLLLLGADKVGAMPTIRGIDVSPPQVTLGSDGQAEVRLVIHGDDEPISQCGITVEVESLQQKEQLRVETLRYAKDRKSQFPTEISLRLTAPGRFVVRATGSVQLVPERLLLGLYLACEGTAESVVEVLPYQGGQTGTLTKMPTAAPAAARQTTTPRLNTAECDMTCRAERGDADAMNDLGLKYAAGEGVEKSEVLAVQWFTRAAGKGHPVALQNLAFMYETGRGTPLNYRLAMDYYRKAAAVGQPESMRAIAGMYVKGQGVDRDLIEAYAWANLAAARSHGDEREKSEKLRERIAASLSRKELARAQDRSAEIDRVSSK